MPGDLDKLMTEIVPLLTGALLVTILILIVRCYNKQTQPGCGCDKESFLKSNSPVAFSSTGAIVGNGIMTNQTTRMPMDDVLKQVSDNRSVYDGEPSPGVSVGSGFDNLYSSHLDIQDIDARADNGYQQRTDLSEISQKIASAGSNATNNIFSRAGSQPTKLLLAPNEVRCVVDEKYVSERNRNRQISTVGTVIPTQGYDLNIDRIGEELTDTHFSSISSNRRRKRIPTAAGAVTSDNNSGPVGDVAENEVEFDGGRIKINNTIANGNDVVAEVDTNTERFTSKYVKQ